MNIHKLSDKYLVLKRSDIKQLSPDLKHNLNEIIDTVGVIRESQHKFPQQYAVLNIGEDANVDYLMDQLSVRYQNLTTPYVSVKDLAIDIINSTVVSGNP